MPDVPPPEFTDPRTGNVVSRSTETDDEWRAFTERQTARAEAEQWRSAQRREASQESHSIDVVGEIGTLFILGYWLRVLGLFAAFLSLLVLVVGLVLGLVGLLIQRGDSIPSRASYDDFAYLIVSVVSGLIMATVGQAARVLAIMAAPEGTGDRAEGWASRFGRKDLRGFWRRELHTPPTGESAPEPPRVPSKLPGTARTVSSVGNALESLHEQSRKTLRRDKPR